MRDPSVKRHKLREIRLLTEPAVWVDRRGRRHGSGRTLCVCGGDASDDEAQRDERTEATNHVIILRVSLRGALVVRYACVKRSSLIRHGLSLIRHAPIDEMTWSPVVRILAETSHVDAQFVVDTPRFIVDTPRRNAQ